MWAFCQLLSIFIPSMHLELGNNHRMDLGTLLGQLCKGSELKLWLVDQNDALGLLELVSVESQSQVIPTIWLFLFPQYTVTLVKGCRSFWGRLGERLTVLIFSNVPGFSLKGTWPLFYSRILAWVWELIEGLWLCFYDSALTFVHET